MKSKVVPKTLLFLSVFSLLYFLYIGYLSFYPPTDFHVVRFIGELLTLPLLLFVLFGILFGAVQLFRKVYTNFYSGIVLLNLTTAIFLTIITVNG